jgi:hypothetical protein
MSIRVLGEFVGFYDAMPGASAVVLARTTRTAAAP